MAGLLSGLSSLGLGDLENLQLYEEPKDDKNGDKAAAPIVVEEKDLVYDRNFQCPICDSKITSKVMKTGKAKLLRTDSDLRAVYEGIDVQKYDAIMCPKCGFTALTRYFIPMTSVQTKLIKEKICANVKVNSHDGEVYTYEEAMERYKLALACAVVKQAKASEKAYICLKSAWVLRGWQEKLVEDGAPEAQIAELKAAEKEYQKNALEGFVAAFSAESFPMCGMDETTVNFLVAALAIDTGRFEIASKLIASILTSPSANARMKDKARDLKDQLLEELKKTKG